MEAGHAISLFRGLSRGLAYYQEAWLPHLENIFDHAVVCLLEDRQELQLELEQLLLLQGAR